MTVRARDYGDCFKPTPRASRDQWDSVTSDVPFDAWLRRRTPSGMDPQEQELAHALEQRTSDINHVAQAEMEKYLGHPFFRHGANPYGRPRTPQGGA